VIEKLYSLLNVRPNENRIAILLVGIMFFSSAGYSLGGTGIEALFFARYGTGLLPYLYMGLGVLSLVITLGMTGLIGRVKRERIYVFVPLTSVILLLLAWGLLFTKSNMIFPALWVGKEALNTIVSMVTWNTAAAVCDSRQAKRLFPLFNAARILGAVIGGLGTGLLVKSFGTQNLVFIWALSMALVFVITQILMRGKSSLQPYKIKRRTKHRQASFFTDMNKGWQYVKTSELMRWISIASILFSVLYFSIALPFSRSVTIQYPNENQLASFLGLFNGLSTAAAFIVSFFFANRLYARFGIMNILLALPVIYLMGFGTLTLFNLFTLIVTFRFIQMLWLSGAADSAYQTMFCVVPTEKRDQVTSFLNGVPSQAGVFIAGGILIAGESAFTAQQLYLIGFISAILTTFIIWRASLAYRGALVYSLQQGRPTIFGGMATNHDATSLTVAIENIHHPDPLVRLVSVEMIGQMEKVEPLLAALQDTDRDVRIAALNGLEHLKAFPPGVVQLLSDPESLVRRQAIRTLRNSAADQIEQKAAFESALFDNDSHVQIEAGLGLLKLGILQPARDIIREKCIHGSVDQRVHALSGLSESADEESYSFIAKQLQDPEPRIRRAAALALASFGNKAIPILIKFLSDENFDAREGIATALASIGTESILPTLSALDDEALVEGALHTLTHLPLQGQTSKIRTFISIKSNAALYYEGLARKINPENDRYELLIDALRTKAKKQGVYLLQAVGLLDDRESIQTAIGSLQSKESNLQANALETLESISNSRLVRPVLHLWEKWDSDNPEIDLEHKLIIELLSDKDDWLRACAAFIIREIETAKSSIDKLAMSDPNPLVREITSQGEPMETILTLPTMERVLLLRHVPLLADLTGSDLQRIAALATEQHADDNEVIFEQGDAGEEMYVIVHGEVKVMITANDESEKEVARRKTGEVIGEMSLISGEPRIASVIASGKVHLLCLDRKSFEGLLRERPEVCFAVMRVLCNRLKEATR
jgi:HEAT repeat protein